MKLSFAGAASLFIAAAAHAQNPPAQPPPAEAKTGKATIVGIAIDSLNADYLVGAEVVVQGANVSKFTDSLGRFRVDSLTPGTYQVGIFHPLLDTLGVSLATQPFHVGADSVSLVTLSVPSAPTLIARSCTARPRSQGSSAVIGQVVDPETLQPVQGADVSIAWTEIEVSKEFGVRQSPRVLRDSTDAIGRFSLCGLPSSLEASLKARRGNSVTAEVPIALGDAPVELFARTLLLSAADSGTKSGNAVLSGRVILEGNAPGGGSRVEVHGTDAVTTTNEKGEFTLKNLPSGSHVVVARHLGYAADAVPVDLSSREAKSVTIKLPKFVNVMDPVLVTARRTAALDRVGFARRQRMGQGRYIGPEQLARMRPNRVTDVLRQVPGLRVINGPQGEIIESTRGTGSVLGGSCVQFYVDEMRWQTMEPGDVNSFISGHEIVAIEVYQGSATPAQYVAPGRGNCTTILLWTRMRIPD